MKTNRLQKGFTLIELLVVIVIIGILATIGVATFQGYFAKARDVERQTAVRNIALMIKADQVTSDSPDYGFGETDGADDGAVETALKAILTSQGYSVPAVKSSVPYFYLVPGTTTTVDASPDDFAVFACKESELDDANASLTGATSDGVSNIAYIDGTSAAIALVTEAIAGDACVTTPVAPDMSGTSPDYIAIDLD